MTLSQRTFVAMPETDGDNGGMVLVLDPDAQLNAVNLDPRTDLCNHSPTGFAWGYLGSGPAQLALAILAEVSNDDQTALDLHQAFKEQVIAGKPSATWSISEEYVRGWLKASRPVMGTGWDTPDYAPHNEVHTTEILVDEDGEELDPVLVLELVRNGYSDLRVVPGRGVCGLHRYIYTVGVCYGMDMTGMKGRFCFDTEQNARLFLKDWDGETIPEVGVDGCTALK